MDALVKNIVSATDERGKPNLQKFDYNWLLEVLTAEKLSLIESKFKEYRKKKVDLIDFCKIFLSVFDHDQNDTIYLVLTLIDLFKETCEFYNLSDLIEFKDFTNFVVDVRACLVNGLSGSWRTITVNISYRKNRFPRVQKIKIGIWRSGRSIWTRLLYSGRMRWGLNGYRLTPL